MAHDNLIILRKRALALERRNHKIEQSCWNKNKLTPRIPVGLFDQFIKRVLSVAVVVRGVPVFRRDHSDSSRRQSL